MKDIPRVLVGVGVLSKTFGMCNFVLDSSGSPCPLMKHTP